MFVLCKNSSFVLTVTFEALAGDGTRSSFSVNETEAVCVVTDRHIVVPLGLPYLLLRSFSTKPVHSAQPDSAQTNKTRPDST